MFLITTKNYFVLTINDPNEIGLDIQRKFRYRNPSACPFKIEIRSLLTKLYSIF